MPRPAAIFDVDGTLLAGTSAERLFVRRALAAGRLTPAGLAAGALQALLAWATRRVSTPLAAKMYLRGAACAPLESLGVDCVRSDVLPRLRPALLATLRRRQQAGDYVVLLTGTLDFLGMELARCVGADAVLPARLERHAGRFTGRVLDPYPHGTGKVVALVELARAQDLDLAMSHAWGNRGSDVAHLERVGFAHAVAPDPRLRRQAGRRGWSIHDPDDQPEPPRPRPQR